jgi:hypothetical protein
MRKWRRNRRIRRFVVALAVAAVMAPAAQARIDEAGASDGAAAAAAVRPDDLALRPGPTGSVAQLAIRPDDLALRPGTHLQPTGDVNYGQFAYRRALPQDYGVRTIQVAGTADGFHWSDAGIGAGSLFGVLLLVSGAALLTRHVDRQKHSLA